VHFYSSGFPQVFLKISTDADNPGNLLPDYGASEEQNLIGDFGDIQIRPGAIFWSICLLRIRRLIRSPQSLFFLLIMPLLLAAIGLYLVKISTVETTDASLNLSHPQGITNSCILPKFLVLQLT